MRLIDRIADDARRAVDREARRPWRDKFPAVLTAVDTGYSPPRYAWTEQTWGPNGERITKVGGRFGTATSSPAYAYGDGQVLSAADLPMPVTLRRRLTVRGLGAVYEFPLYCGCVAGGAGSGGSGGFVLAPCCPDPLPRTLHVTLLSALDFLDGRVVRLDYNPPGFLSGNHWASDQVFFDCHPGPFIPLPHGCDYPGGYYFLLRCQTVPSPHWWLDIYQFDTLGAGDVYCPFWDGSSGIIAHPFSIQADSEVCSPALQSVFRCKYGRIAPTCAIPATAVTLTVTE